MQLDHLRDLSLETFGRVRSFFKSAGNRFRIIGHDMPKPIFENHKRNITERNITPETWSSEKNTSELNTSSASNFSPHVGSPIDYGQMRLNLVREVALKVMEEGQVDEWMHTALLELDGLTPAQLSSESSSAVFEIEVLLGLRDRQTRRPISFK